MKSNTHQIIRLAVKIYVAFSMVLTLGAFVAVAFYFHQAAVNRGDTFLQVLTVAVVLITVPIVGAFIGCGIARLFKKKDSKSCQKTQ